MKALEIVGALIVFLALTLGITAWRMDRPIRERSAKDAERWE